MGPSAEKEGGKAVDLLSLEADLVKTFRGFPHRITVEPTNSCNISCTFCPRNYMENNFGFMEESLFRKIVDECALHLPVSFVPFFRGESLLHSDFIKFVRYASERGLSPIQFSTNAMLLDESLSGELLDCGIDFISFSIDTMNKQQYESVRVGADHDAVIANILRFIKMRDDSGSELRIQVSSVSTKETRPFEEDFIDFWKGRADVIRIYEEHTKDGKFGSLDIYENSFSRRLACKKPFNDIVVYWNGDVALCNHDWRREDKLGNVSESSLEEIFNSEKYKRIRSGHLDGNLKDSGCCADCDHWRQYCSEGSRIGRIIGGR